MHTAAPRPVAGLCAMIDALQVPSLVEQGNGLHIYQQNIATVAMVLAMRHPLQVLGTIILLIAVLVVHLQPFAPAWHEGSGYKYVYTLVFYFAFVTEVNM